MAVVVGTDVFAGFVDDTTTDVALAALVEEEVRTVALVEEEARPVALAALVDEERTAPVLVVLAGLMELVAKVALLASIATEEELTVALED